VPDLNFSIDGAAAVLYATSPLLALKLRIDNADEAEQIHSVLLQCQIQIESPRRAYTAVEQAGLTDLFGEPERWGQTLRTMLWTHASVNVTGFSGSTVIDVPLPCTFDLNVAATKYFHALERGEVPICIQFSGTVFYQSEDSGLQVARIPWSKEARYRLPVSVWNEAIDHYYPNTAWLSLRRDVFDRLHEYKRRKGILTWEETVEDLLARAGDEVLS